RTTKIRACQPTVDSISGGIRPHSTRFATFIRACPLRGAYGVRAYYAAFVGKSNRMQSAVRWLHASPFRSLEPPYVGRYGERFYKTMTKSLQRMGHLQD